MSLLLSFKAIYANIKFRSTVHSRMCGWAMTQILRICAPRSQCGPVFFIFWCPQWDLTTLPQAP